MVEDNMLIEYKCKKAQNKMYYAIDYISYIWYIGIIRDIYESEEILMEYSEKVIFGIDLGIGSVGWAVLGDNGKEILDNFINKLATFPFTGNLLNNSNNAQHAINKNIFSYPNL